jgi:hypothetical protein
MKPKYKVGQILRWINPDNNVVSVKVMKIQGGYYDLLTVYPSNPAADIFKRRTDDLDDFSNVSALIEPNKIWKELCQNETPT